MMGLGPRVVFCASRVRHLLAACILVGAALSSASTAPVANTSEDSLKVIATVTVGSGPQGLAVTPNGNEVYVANYLASTVSVISTASDSVIATVALGSLYGPTDVAIAPDGATAFILVGGNKHSKYYLGGAAISPDGQALYVTETGRRAITTVKTLRGRQVGTPLQVGRQPLGVAISASSSLMYVSNYTGHRCFDGPRVERRWHG
jgi:YVTN family beta-propeller protein